MEPYGEHAKTSSQIKVGKHGVIVRPERPIWHIALIVMLAAALGLVPITIAWRHVELESLAYADSTRTAFPELNDASALIEEGNLPETAVDYTGNVRAKMQNSVMSGGCEIVALGIALESMGIEADLDKLVSNHLVIDGHFATGYSGDPYSQGAGYPQGIVEAANGYLVAQGASARAHDLTGSSFEQLKDIIASGRPVLVWTTMGSTDPQFTGATDEGMEWYSNEHCVVLYGFEGNQALISDPLEGLIERDEARFADLYAQCGSMAAAIF